MTRRRGVKLGKPMGAEALRRAEKGGVELRDAITPAGTAQELRRCWRHARGRRLEHADDRG